MNITTDVEALLASGWMERQALEMAQRCSRRSRQVGWDVSLGGALVECRSVGRRERRRPDRLELLEQEVAELREAVARLSTKKFENVDPIDVWLKEHAAELKDRYPDHHIALDVSGTVLVADQDADAFGEKMRLLSKDKREQAYVLHASTL